MNGARLKSVGSVRSGEVRWLSRVAYRGFVRGALDQFADDHGGAAGDGGAGVGDEMCVGLGDEDLFVGEAEGLGGDLAEDGVGALAELGGGDEDAGAACLG